MLPSTNYNGLDGTTLVIQLGQWNAHLIYPTVSA